MLKLSPLLILLSLLFFYGPTKSKYSDEFIKTQNELTEKLTEISKQTIFNGFGVALTSDN